MLWLTWKILGSTAKKVKNIFTLNSFTVNDNSSYFLQVNYPKGSNPYNVNITEKSSLVFCWPGVCNISINLQNISLYFFFFVEILIARQFLSFVLVHILRFWWFFFSDEVKILSWLKILGLLCYFVQQYFCTAVCTRIQNGGGKTSSWNNFFKVIIV